MYSIFRVQSGTLKLSNVCVFLMKTTSRSAEIVQILIDELPVKEVKLSLLFTMRMYRIIQLQIYISNQQGSKKSNRFSRFDSFRYFYLKSRT